MKSERNRTRFIFIFILFFAGFIGIFLWPSAYSKALQEIEACKNKQEVEKVWFKYSPQLGTDDDFNAAIREKLDQLPLTHQEIDSCFQWLPDTPINLNVIFVLDLSTRIRDTVTSKTLKEDDIDILKTIRGEFDKHVGFRDGQDRFTVVLPLVNPAPLEIKRRMDNLYLNMSDKENTISTPYLTDHQKNKFSQNINELYSLSMEAELQTDFYSFFKNRLLHYLEYSTVYERFVNKLVILTDGNIEHNTGGGITAVKDFESEFESTNNRDEMIQIIHKHNAALTPPTLDLSNTDIFISQISAPPGETVFAEDVLTAYWYDWFDQMGKVPTITTNNLIKGVIIESAVDFMQIHSE